MDKFDYDVFVASDTFFSGGGLEAKKILNGMGDRGWELVSVTQLDGGAIAMVFKKRR